MSRAPRCNTRGERYDDVREGQPRGWRPPGALQQEKRATLVLAALALLLVVGVSAEVARRPIIGGEMADGGVPEVPRGYMVQAVADGSVAEVARPMPRRPLQGQKLEPCDARIEKAINGACWMPLDVSPGDDTCGPKAYLYNGKCYVAVSPAPKPDVSMGK
jgi:hypothetical protein